METPYIFGQDETLCYESGPTVRRDDNRLKAGKYLLIVVRWICLGLLLEWEGQFGRYADRTDTGESSIKVFIRNVLSFVVTGVCGGMGDMWQTQR